MPLEVRHTNEARRDLREIWNYIAQDNPHAADRQLRRIAEVVTRISIVPEMGRARPDLGQTLRSFPTGNYIVFYEVTATSVWVVRVLHSARDISPDRFQP